MIASVKIKTNLQKFLDIGINRRRKLKKEKEKQKARKNQTKTMNIFSLLIHFHVEKFVFC